MLTMNALYFAPVDAKLDLARQLFRQHGARLAADPALTALLGDLERLGEKLAGQMTAMELGTLCGACAARPDGGCCSAFMANETDAVLLLINLLSGRRVERLRDDLDPECCFLGPRGCTLEPKPLFCLNYNCRAIQALPQIDSLLTAASAVLRCQTAIESLLLETIGYRHG